jgi:DNA-directed RNA polymerase sigma subunit (sigma70/sigma32)
MARRRNVELDARIKELLAHGHTYKDIAKRLNITVAAVRSRVHRMRKRGELREPLKPAWDELADYLAAARIRVQHAHDELRLRRPLSDKDVATLADELARAADYLAKAVDIAAFLRAVHGRR